MKIETLAISGVVELEGQLPANPYEENDKFNESCLYFVSGTSTYYKYNGDKWVYVGFSNTKSGKLKIALFDRSCYEMYPLAYVEKFIEFIKNEDIPEFKKRVHLAKWLEENYEASEIRDDTSYYSFIGEFGKDCMKLVEVDTSKLWQISLYYDNFHYTCEYIRYYTVDEEYNTIKEEVYVKN